MLGIQPFSHPEMRMAPEKRAADNYGSAVLELIQSSVSGSNSYAETLAVIEAAQLIYGRALASAVISPQNYFTRALTPSVLNALGRRLVTRGEQVFELEAGRDRARLVAASDWQVLGDGDVYEVTHQTPAGPRVRVLGADRVVHVAPNPDPKRPWCGLSPLRAAITSTQLVSRLEQSLSHELRIKPGAVIPVPPNDDDDDWAALQKSISELDGVLLTETTSTGHSSGLDGTNAPKQDFVPRRIGASPPDALVELRAQAAQSILSALGIPGRRVDGTTSREAYRQMHALALQPLADIVAEQVGEQLDSPGLSMKLTRLRAADMQGASRGWKSLRDGGMPGAVASEIAGFDLPHDLEYGDPLAQQAPAEDEEE